MGRLIAGMEVSLATVLLGGLLTLCSIDSLPLHKAVVMNSATDCTSSCGSHGQPAPLSALTKPDKEDNQPRPPASSWLQPPVNLSLSYIAPIVALALVNHSRKKQLLSVRLRM